MRKENNKYPNMCTRLIRQRELNGSLHCAAAYQSQRLDSCKNLYHKDMMAHFGCVNALSFSHHNGELLATGGDDKRVLVWNVKDGLHKPGYKPHVMPTRHLSNVFCLAFDYTNQKLFSSGNDEQVHVHDMQENKLTAVYMKTSPIYSLATHPFNSDLLAIAAEAGQVEMIDMRQPSNSNYTELASSEIAYHGVFYHPREPQMICTSNSREGICLYDARKPKEVFKKFGESSRKESAMSACFNEHGTEILVLRRRSTPRLFSILKEEPICDFEAPNYINYCTMKNGCFAGPNDEYIVSGSDDFQVYMWKKPDLDGVEGCHKVTEANLVLRGHRSIVNQTKYNKSFNCLATSGVEKCVKMWSPDPCTDLQTDISKETEEPLRDHYTRNAYIDLVLQNGNFATSGEDSETTDEDPRMLAFFDSLLEHDLALSPSESETEDDTDESDADGPLVRDEEQIMDYLDSLLFDRRIQIRRSNHVYQRSNHSMRLRSHRYQQLERPMVSLRRIDIPEPIQIAIPELNSIQVPVRPFYSGAEHRFRMPQMARRSRPYIRQQGMLTRSVSRRMTEEARRRAFVNGDDDDERSTPPDVFRRLQTPRMSTGRRGQPPPRDERRDVAIRGRPLPMGRRGSHPVGIRGRGR